MKGKLAVILFFTFLSIGQLYAQEIAKIKITELDKRIKESKGPLIINFWATFCKPCIEEMPWLEEAAKKHQADGVQLLLVSLDLESDYPVKVNKFVQRMKIASTVLWLDEFNADYFCPIIDPKWSGAIPATLFINNQKGYRQFREEQLSHEKLEQEISAMIGK